MKVLYPVCTIFVLKIDIPMNILFLVGGLLLILLGANGLTDGAASVAKRFHIPSIDRKSTRLNSSHWNKSRMPSSA